MGPDVVKGKGDEGADAVGRIGRRRQRLSQAPRKPLLVVVRRGNSGTWSFARELAVERAAGNPGCFADLLHAEPLHAPAADEAPTPR